jgi:hypothetical protein
MAGVFVVGGLIALVVFAIRGSGDSGREKEGRALRAYLDAAMAVQEASGKGAGVEGMRERLKKLGELDGADIRAIEDGKFLRQRQQLDVVRMVRRAKLFFEDSLQREEEAGLLTAKGKKLFEDAKAGVGVDSERAQDLKAHEGKKLLEEAKEKRESARTMAKNAQGMFGQAEKMWSEGEARNWE